MAEAALADEWVINGDRVALQRRVLRLGKPPRRWKRPSWAAVALREPLEVCPMLHNLLFWVLLRPPGLLLPAENPFKHATCCATRVP